MSVVVADHRSPEESDIEPDGLRQILEKIYLELDLQKGDIEISLVNDRQMISLNSKYRNINETTNVLSFPQYCWEEPGVCLNIFPKQGTVLQPVLWGEVIVSCETVSRQANSAGLSFAEEIVRMCIHGMLHLFGYDHHDDKDYKLMTDKEQLAMEIALSWLEHKKL
ncbi:rRNA maturation RNase YbeY [bacterium]|nr:rRNA maturation RNase YbeY [bacterium]